MTSGRTKLLSAALALLGGSAGGAVMTLLARMLGLH